MLSIGEAEMHAKLGRNCTMMVNSLHLSLDLFKKLLQLVLVSSLHRPFDAEAFLLVGLGDHVDWGWGQLWSLHCLALVKAYRGHGQRPGGRFCRCSGGC